jgi:hypothetical protein
LKGGDPLRESTQDQDDLGAGVVRARPESTREQVEHRTAFPAAVIDHRGTVAHVRALRSRKEMPARTAQTMRMKNMEQKNSNILVH